MGGQANYATFQTYDEEKALIEEFGVENVTWDGQEFHVRVHGKWCYVRDGAVTRLGIEEVRSYLDRMVGH